MSNPQSSGVYVLGTGMIQFGKFADRTLAEIGWPSLREALIEAEVEPRSLDAIYCGTALGGMLAGQRVAKALGLSGMPIVNVENADRQIEHAVLGLVHERIEVLGFEDLLEILTALSELRTCGRAALVFVGHCCLLRAGALNYAACAASFCAFSTASSIPPTM